MIRRTNKIDLVIVESVELLFSEVISFKKKHFGVFMCVRYKFKNHG